MKGPLQIIAELLPLGPDTYIVNREEVAIEILMALDRAGFVIHWRTVQPADTPHTRAPE